jgi:hypothetical protein
LNATPDEIEAWEKMFATWHESLDEKERQQAEIEMEMAATEQLCLISAHAKEKISGGCGVS